MANVTSLHRQLTAPESTFVGLIIGKGGANIAKMRGETNCEIWVSKTMPPTIIIRGEQPELALSRINDILLSASKKQNRKLDLSSGDRKITTSGKTNAVGELQQEESSTMGTSIPTTSVSQPVPNPASKRLLYVDILNFGTHFFSLRDWSLTKAMKKARDFVLAASAANWTLVLFVDCGCDPEGEARIKWRSRRLKEVTQQQRNIPQAMATQIGEMFFLLGVDVRYSLDADNDDTLASWAFHDRASILSGDKDFFRYDHPNGETIVFDVYSKFVVRKGRLILTKRPPFAFIGQRHILVSPPPRTRSPGEDVLVTFPATAPYLRGAPSPLVRYFGYNPHEIIRPLRAALYFELFGDGKDLVTEIVEEFPVWNSENERAEFSVVRVPIPSQRDVVLYEMVSTPENVYRHFFAALNPSEKPETISQENWFKHIYACRTVVVEICCSFPPREDRAKMRFLDEMRKSESWK